MAENEGVVTLRLHPDGHWMPNTVGRWRWLPLHCADDERVTPLEFEVFKKHGSLMIRPVVRTPSILRIAEVPYESVRMMEPGEWEWVPPVDDSEITP